MRRRPGDGLQGQLRLGASVDSFPATFSSVPSESWWIWLATILQLLEKSHPMKLVILAVGSENYQSIVVLRCPVLTTLVNVETMSSHPHQISTTRFVLPWSCLTGLPKPSALIRGAKVDLNLLILPVSVLYLGSFTLDSPLRWGLNLVKLAPLIYLRDALILLFIFFEFFLALKRHKINRYLGLAVLLIGFHFTIGLISFRNVPQSLFGLKVFLPFFLGVIAAIRLSRANKISQIQIEFGVLWGISLLGIALEAMKVPMPWKGFSVEVGDIVIQGNRSWTAAGIDRLSGFARASYDTSIFLLLFSISFIYRVRPILRWVIILLSLIGIVATTTKVTVLATIGCMGIMLLLSFRLPMRRAIWSLFGVITLCFTVLPPILLRPDVINISLDDPVIAFSFASFMDRIQNTWPDGFALLKLTPLPFLGRGIGGIGVAQSYFETGIFNPGDNLFVYLWVATGFLSILYFAWMLMASLRESGPIGEQRTRFAFFGTTFILGAAMNTLESSSAFFLIGFWLIIGTAKPQASLH